MNSLFDFCLSVPTQMRMLFSVNVMHFIFVFYKYFFILIHSNLPIVTDFYCLNCLGNNFLEEAIFN